MRGEPMSSNSCSKKPESFFSRCGRRWAVLCCSLLSGVCAAANSRGALPQGVPPGGSEMRWTGFRNYHATLWAEQPARSFFAIWLGEGARDKDLRRKLIGEVR